MATARARHGDDDRARDLRLAANKDVAKRWRGIGIRIEDDVLVTREGPDVLTADLAASIEEIEALMAARA